MLSNLLMWIILSLIAAACFTFMYIAFKYLQVANVNPLVTLVYIFFFGLILNFIHLSVEKLSLSLNKQLLFLLIVTSICSYVGNLAIIKAMALAPNPGYASAVSSSQVILLTVVSVYLFGSDLDTMKAIGVVLCVIGVALVSL